ncbi:hypothetical protein NNX28_17040 [Arthrobacter sp. zg-Y859]|uniref:Uncharacterized protein n=1 Tax=Arthrobacter jinronghuae TaxID=2964609 RepID=A0ABT1NYE4_9MICC|nr:hypothetical protein [Arthrobacter jinronghuae]MCQ1951626.1 hypothetical protein [Arthrobacter jinronghuae]UWX79660.1 hypothetical protein N2K98_05540 [Arthrobacter jinronghuae]
MVDASGIPRRVTETTPAQKHNDLARKVEQQGSARRLQSASIGKPDEGQIFLASDGQRFVDEEGVERIRFRTSDGSAAFDGPVNIQGPLTLRPGSIENDALMSPLAYEASYNDSSALVVTSEEATVCQLELRIPPGYTRALVVVQGSVGVVNPTDNPSSIAGRVYIKAPNLAAEQWGAKRFQRVEGKSDGALVPVRQQVYDNLDGGSIACRLVLQNTGSNWGATQGGATLNAFAIYTR